MFFFAYTKQKGSFSVNADHITDLAISPYDEERGALVAFMDSGITLALSPLDSYKNINELLRRVTNCLNNGEMDFSIRFLLNNIKTES